MKKIDFKTFLKNLKNWGKKPAKEVFPELVKDSSFFGSQGMIMFLMLCGMVNNFWHNAMLYNSIQVGEYQGFFVVLIFDLGLIALMRNGRAESAQALAWILGLINLLYWNFIEDVYQWEAVLDSAEKLKLVMAKVIYTLVFTFFLHKFSKLYVQKSNDIPNLEHIKAAMVQLRAEYEQVKAEREHNKAQIEQLKDVVLKYQNEHVLLLPYREKWRKGDWLPDVDLPLGSMLKSYNAKK